jgi:hypothetical protein
MKLPTNLPAQRTAQERSLAGAVDMLALDMEEPKMKLIHKWQVKMHVTSQLLAVIAFASLSTLSLAEEASVEAIKAGIEGVYVLQEWHRNGEILRPPLIDGRSVLLNNRLIFIVHDRAQASNQTTRAGYATYILEPGQFSYSYEAMSVITQTADGTSVSEKLPWEGLRTFAASIENNEIHFRATNGPQEFRFTADGLSYSDGKQMRVYRRGTDK